MMVQLNLLPWHNTASTAYLPVIMIMSSIVFISSGLLYLVIAYPLRQHIAHNSQLQQTIQRDAPIIQEIQSIQSQKHIIISQLNHWYSLPQYQYQQWLRDVILPLPDTVWLTQLIYQTKQWQLSGETTAYPQLLTWMQQIEQLTWVQSVMMTSNTTEQTLEFTVTLVVY